MLDPLQLLLDGLCGEKLSESDHCNANIGFMFFSAVIMAVALHALLYAAWPLVAGVAVLSLGMLGFGMGYFFALQHCHKDVPCKSQSGSSHTNNDKHSPAAGVHLAAVFMLLAVLGLGVLFFFNSGFAALFIHGAPSDVLFGLGALMQLVGLFGTVATVAVLANAVPPQPGTEIQSEPNPIPTTPDSQNRDGINKADRDPNRESLQAASTAQDGNNDDVSPYNHKTAEDSALLVFGNS